jgi:glycosyltransferase involved in cell wall biosynthesis
MTARPALVVVSPIEPSATGNGLAMRVDVLVRAAAVDHDVHLVVVPVAGRPPVVASPPTVSSRHVVRPLDPGDHRALDRWLADATWRGRLGRLAPLPDPAARVPLEPGHAVSALLDAPSTAGVLACRLTTGLLGLHLAELARVPFVVDADDDDAALALQLGDHDGAGAWDRLASVVLPSATVTLGASPTVTGALDVRHDLGGRVAVVPNATPPPPASVPSRPGRRRVLMVANFTYPPNAEGARWLAEEVVGRLPRPWTVDLVGPAGAAVRALDGDRLRVVGAVQDLDEWYGGADVVVAPLLAGSGSRIKVLEAFAHQRPLVATTPAVEGLTVVAGREALVADDPADFAEAVDSCTDENLVAGLVARARELVAGPYHRDTVIAETARTLSSAVQPSHRREPSHEEPEEEPRS